MYDIKKIHQANNIQDVLRILVENPNIKIISGGTDVLIKMKERKLKEVEIVNIGDIPELKGISIDSEDTIIIKAATCFFDIITNEDILKHIPTLAKACNQIGSPQIRNVATIGGNLCNGAVSADVVPILLVLDAELHIKNVSGEVKIINVNDFHTGPGQTSLEIGKEILTEIHIKKKNYHDYGFDYFKYGKRNAMEIATLGCATGVKLNDKKNKITDFKISYSVAAPTPRRCSSLERLLIGKNISEETIKLIKPENIEELKPRDSWRASRDFRLQLIKEIGRRSALEAIRSLGGM